MDGLKSQIHENCKLALPEGLKDLMSDISREVLRAQPQNLYQFITNYLGALLEARETLTIACQVCSDICKCTCDHIKPELYHELRKIGLDEENVENAIEIIEKHLEGDQKANKPAKEQSLLLKLLRKTSINDTQLPAIQQAIQKAFKRYNLSQGDLTMIAADFRNESTMEKSKATHNTLKLQKQNKPKEQKETGEIFVAPDFKPRVTTISSVSLAGSYVPLPKFRPYCAHDYEILSRISEREHVSIHYTTVANTTKTKPKKIEIKETSVIENDVKNEPFLCLDDDIHQNEDDNNEYLSTDEYYVATTSTGLKLNRVEVNAEEMEEPDKHFVSFDDSNDEMNTEGHSDDEVQEFIENVESESDSNVSSIEEALQNDRDG